MKQVLGALLVLLMAGCASGPRSPADSALTLDLRCNQLYHEWIAAVYKNRRIALSSQREPYVSMPEFRRIVALGEPAIPFLAGSINGKIDGHYYLALAIMEIKGWRESDIYLVDGEGLPEKVLNQIKREK